MSDNVTHASCKRTKRSMAPRSACLQDASPSSSGSLTTGLDVPEPEHVESPEHSRALEALEKERVPQLLVALHRQAAKSCVDGAAWSRGLPAQRRTKLAAWLVREFDRNGLDDTILLS
jgi:hypothetical protein